MFTLHCPSGRYAYASHGHAAWHAWQAVTNGHPCHVTGPCGYLRTYTPSPSGVIVRDASGTPIPYTA